MRKSLKIVVGLWFGLLILGSCEDEGTQKIKFKGGDGSKGDPYQIENIVQLEGIGRTENLKMNFKLVKDIDLSGVNNFKPIAYGTEFFGTFDGNGKMIRNLKINRPTEKNIGLFGRISSGSVVKNVKLENVDVTGKEKVGGLVGLSHGTIENSYVMMGKVTGLNEDVGGLVGYSDGLQAKIEKSYSTANVKGKDGVGGLVGHNFGKVKKSLVQSYATGIVTGTGSRVGGLAGENNRVIENSYATGKVTGKVDVGGFVGWNNGQIKNSYATGNVAGTSNFGGFIGKNHVKSAGNNYWKAGSAAKGVGDGSQNNVQRQTDQELKRLSVGGTNWNALSIWDFKAGEYPKLKWQK